MNCSYTTAAVVVTQCSKRTAFLTVLPSLRYQQNTRLPVIVAVDVDVLVTNKTLKNCEF